jgi:serine/threonine protein kinase
MAPSQAIHPVHPADNSSSNAAASRRAVVCAPIRPHCHVPSFLIPAAGARLCYTDVEANGPPQPPAPETQQACIHLACASVSIKEHAEDEGATTSTTPKLVPCRKRRRSAQVPPVICLLRGVDPERAYGRLSSKEPVSLNHHAPGWGRLWCAVAYPRISGRTFCEGGAQLVAIKQLQKAVVTEYLLEDGPENPYTEIARLQEFSRQSTCVLPCLEVLEDCHSLYMVLPYAVGGTLYDTMFTSPLPLTERRTHGLFLELLEILVFLQASHIHHRDLSPDNLLFYNNRLVVTDFALSMRIPVNVVTGERTLIQSVGTFGTHAYLAPEIVATMGGGAPAPFDGVAADLWSVMVILYNLHTRQKLYDQPLSGADWAFTFWIAQGSLMSVARNEAMLDDGDLPRCVRSAAAQHLSWIGTSLGDLLGHSLRADPRDRWSLAQVLESDYVRQTPL